MNLGKNYNYRNNFKKPSGQSLRSIYEAGIRSNDVTASNKQTEKSRKDRI